MASLRAGGIAGVVMLLPAVLGLAFVGVDATLDALGHLCEARALLREGLAPWLAPDFALGAPLLGSPSGQILYPPRWLGILVGGDSGLALEMTLHFALAAAGAAWLVRTFGVRSTAATGAGVVFAATGTVVDLLTHGMYLTGAAWLPMGWAGARSQLHQRGVAFGSLATGVSVAMLLLGGEPQSTAVLVFLVGIESVLTLNRLRPFHRGFLALVVGGVSGGLLGLVPWMPILAEAVLTRRGAALNPDAALTASYAPLGWLATLAPNILTQPLKGGANLWVLMQSSEAWLMPWNRSHYLGPLFIAFLVVGAFHGRARTPVVIAGVALLFALGSRTPVLPALVDLVPAVAVFRYPAKYLLVFTLASVVPLGLALDGIRSNVIRRRCLVACGVLLVCHIVGIGVVWRGADALDSLTVALTGPDGPPLSTPHATLLSGLSHAALFLGAGTIMLLRRSGTTWLLVVVLADLGIAAAQQVNLAPPLATAHSPLKSIPVNGDAPVFCHHDAVNQGTFSDTASYSNEEQALFARLLAVPNTNGCEGLSAAIAYSPLQTRANARLQAEVQNDQVWASRALGCTHVITPRRPTDEDVTVESVDGSVELLNGQAGAIRVARINDPIPPAFVVIAPRFAASEMQAMQWLAGQRTAQGALSVIDDPLRHEPAQLPPATGVQSLSLEHEAPYRARIRVTGKGSAVVGMRAAFLVGWTAKQRGQELPVVRASLTHVAAVVHDINSGPVEFEYVPPRLGVSACLGLLGLLGLAWLGLSLTRRFSFTP